MCVKCDDASVKGDGVERDDFPRLLDVTNISPLSRTTNAINSLLDWKKKERNSKL